MKSYNYSYLILFYSADYYFFSCQYHIMPAYAVILDKVPGLLLVAKANIRKFVADKKMGIHNNAHPFSTPELADNGIGSPDTTKPQSL